MAKCEHCDGTGEIDHCAKCGKRFAPSDARLMLADKDRDMRERWFGPFCTGCIGIELDQFREPRHSRDETERHDMADLLGDLRTRPTDPPPTER